LNDGDDNVDVGICFFKYLGVGVRVKPLGGELGSIGR
jgi:hypothetical protein